MKTNNKSKKPIQGEPYINWDEYVGKGVWEHMKKESYQRQTYVHTEQGGKDMILEALKAFDSLRELDKLKKEKELLQKPTSELIDIVLNDIDKLK